MVHDTRTQDERDAKELREPNQTMFTKEENKNDPKYGAGGIRPKNLIDSGLNGELEAAAKMQNDLKLPESALNIQQGGNHYKQMKIQPVEFIHANAIPFIEGSVIKYVSRWRSKNGIEDLKKAKHFLDLLIELETKANEERAK